MFLVSHIDTDFYLESRLRASMKPDSSERRGMQRLQFIIQKEVSVKIETNSGESGINFTLDPKINPLKMKAVGNGSYEHLLSCTD